MRLKKRGYKLVNGTEGGEGGIVTRLSGVFKHSKETCEKMRRDRLGLRHSVSWCKNISEGQKRSEKTKKCRKEIAVYLGPRK